MTLEILRIPAELVASAWPQALPLLEEPISMSHGCFEPEDVLAWCAQGAAQLWLVIEGDEVIAASTAKIAQYPRKRTYVPLFTGGVTGRLDEWLQPLIGAMEDWARGWGCDALEIVGRKGWTRKIDGEVIATHMWRQFPAMEVH